jgi:cytochrome c-type biogenesis protein CcmH/NrfG
VALPTAARARDAVAAYERALTLTPNRSPALLGLARARYAAGDTAGAADAYRKLLVNWKDADPDLADLAEARTRAAAR